MLGKTHVTAGITCSLLVVRPTTALAFFTAVAGGALGGAICDIDCKRSESRKEAIKGAVLCAVIIAAVVLLDYHVGNGIVDYLSRNLGFPTIAGVIGFLACCMLGWLSKHRTFTHSLLGILAMSTSACFVCAPFGKALFLGMCSHVVLDLLNKKRIQILFPLKRPAVCFGVCTSDGKVNSILMTVFSLGCLLLIPYFAYAAIRSLHAAEFLNDSGFKRFLIYLVIINIITFVAYCIDFIVCDPIGIEPVQNDWHTLLSVLVILGGAFGMLASMLVLGQTIEKCNVNMWVMSISLSLFWAMVCCIVFDPFHFAVHDRSEFLTGLLLYLAVINAVTAIFFLIGLKKHHTKMNPAELVLMLLFIAGGAFSGLLIVTITHKRKKAAMYSDGLPIMLAVQSAAIVCLSAFGILG